MKKIKKIAISNSLEIDLSNDIIFAELISEKGALSDLQEECKF